MQVAHEPNKPPEPPSALIGAGPDMQRQADEVGGKLAMVLTTQAEAMTLSLELYEQYLDECQQLGLEPRRET